MIDARETPEATPNTSPPAACKWTFYAILISLYYIFLVLLAIYLSTDRIHSAVVLCIPIFILLSPCVLCGTCCVPCIPKISRSIKYDQKRDMPMITYEI
jgi:hypothetical protein